MKRSLNFRGSAGGRMALAHLVDLMKKMGKSDDEILEAVKEIQRKTQTDK